LIRKLRLKFSQDGDLNAQITQRRQGVCDGAQGVVGLVIKMFAQRVSDQPQEGAHLFDVFAGCMNGFEFVAGKYVPEDWRDISRLVFVGDDVIDQADRICAPYKVRDPTAMPPNYGGATRISTAPTLPPRNVKAANPGAGPTRQPNAATAQKPNQHQIPPQLPGKAHAVKPLAVDDPVPYNPEATPDDVDEWKRMRQIFYDRGAKRIEVNTLKDQMESLSYVYYPPVEKEAKVKRGVRIAHAEDFAALMFWMCAFEVMPGKKPVTGDTNFNHIYIGDGLWKQMEAIAKEMTKKKKH